MCPSWFVPSHVRGAPQSAAERIPSPPIGWRGCGECLILSISKIVATSIPFSSKVAVEREDFDRLSTLAKKYVTAEKRESKLQKAVDAANKLIAKLKAEIDSLKQEISDYKSVHSKLRAAELERENTELRGKARSYEDVIQRNNLWRFFHPLREKAVTRDEAR